MRRINLNLLSPFRAHFSQREFRVLQQDRVLDVAKTDTDTRCVLHRVRPHANDIGRVCASCRAKDKLKCVFRVDFHAGMFRGGVRHHRGDSRETLPVSIYVQRPDLCRGKFDGLPFQGDRRLSDIAHLPKK